MIISSSREMQQCAKTLASCLRSGDIILLKGDMGSGKTTWTQGLAEGLEITEAVTSPTFVILNEYHSGRLPLYHIDAYRLNDPIEALDIGIEDIFLREGVTVIEWPEVLTPMLPQDFLEITIEKDGDKRRMLFEEKGASDILKRGDKHAFAGH